MHAKIRIDSNLYIIGTFTCPGTSKKRFHRTRSNTQRRKLVSAVAKNSEGSLVNLRQSATIEMNLHEGEARAKTILIKVSFYRVF